MLFSCGFVVKWSASDLNLSSHSSLKIHSNRKYIDITNEISLIFCSLFVLLFRLQIELLVVLKYHQSMQLNYIYWQILSFSELQNSWSLVKVSHYSIYNKLFSEVKEVSSPIPIELPVTIGIFFADMVSSICLWFLQ